MMSGVRATLTIVTLAIVGLAACGDDGNDTRVQARQATERAAEFRSEQVAVTTTTVTADDRAADDASDETAAPPTTSPPTTATVPPTGVVVQIIALDNSFRPEVVEIDVGDEVLWENRGINEHDVLRVEGDGWGVEVEDFQPGDVYAHVFTKPGEYDYYCSIHGNETVGMTGTIVVKA